MELQPLLIGLFAEGPTDLRFLGPIIQKTFVNAQEAVRFTIPPPIEVRGAGDDYPSKLHDATRRAALQGVQVLCVQLDADDRRTGQVEKRKLTPAFDHVSAQPAADRCEHLVPLITVQAMEAWMLGDLDLLRAEIGTSLSAQELQLHRPPQAYARPKDDIEKAIAVARQADTRRRLRGRGPTLATLYAPIGDQLDLDKLAQAAPAYSTFREEVERLLAQVAAGL